MLLDTNILVSGLIFLRGNEHQILRLIEEGKFKLILPESVLIEAKKTLGEKFKGFEELFDIYLSKTKTETISTDRILPLATTYDKQVRDKTDLPIYIAIILTEPQYAITGDKRLREDLLNSHRISRKTQVCTSREFLALT